MPKALNKLSLAAAVLAAAGGAPAQLSSCSSDGAPPPTALLERFINADCAGCWADRQSPDAAAGTLALDWVAPGARGDDAPLSAVATRDAEDRLAALKMPVPPASDSRFTRLAAERVPGLRVAHGLPVADYIGTSIELPPGGGPWRAWLLLVESLPAGTEGSPVARNLVRNAFVADWPAGAKSRYELRPMRIDEGAKPQRLHVVGWVEDSRGRVRAIAQSRCGKG